MKNRKILIVMVWVYLMATILGIHQLFGGNFSGQTFIFIPLGIFIWGDALILGPFLMTASLWLLFKNNSILTGLFFSLYYLTRSFIEILYGLNAQFSLTERPWEIFWIQVISNLPITLIELDVLYQLTFTVFFILSAVVFLSYLRKYLTILKVKNNF